MEMTEARRRRLFIASCMALIATAVTFAIRGDILGDLGMRFSLSNEDLGKAAGAWAYGFTLSIFIGGQLVDLLGMKRIAAAAFLMHFLGVALTIFAGGFWMLFAGTLAVGLGNGLVEAFINPLTATVYPDRKTEKLNLLHVWFPGGIVIGGLVAYGLGRLGATWQVKMAFILLPTLAYGALFLGQEFPPTERVQHGVSTGGMYRAVLRPLFLVLLFCMILTASTELATNQWIAYILSNTAGMAAGGILVLVWINGLMAVGRWFAGPIVHRLSPIGLLIGSATVSAIGLVGLSVANSPPTAIAAATVFAIGICYFWPTMLGVTSERFPEGGALALAIVGGTGTLSAAIFTWILGGLYDRLGPRMALRYMALLPLALIVVFTGIWIYDRARGGYRAVRLASELTSK
jgi:predicted MFS family arabinose efflux permease